MTQKRRLYCLRALLALNWLPARTPDLEAVNAFYRDWIGFGT